MAFFSINSINPKGALTINSSASTISIGNNAVAQNINIGTGGAARTITVGNTTGATALDVNLGTGGLTVDCEDGGGISLDANGAPSNFTLTSTADADDFTIALAGATDSSLILSSTGTAVDALQVTASAGGMDISAAKTMDITTTANNANITIDPHGSGTLALGSADNTAVNIGALAITATSENALTLTDGTASLALAGTGATSISGATTLDLDCTSDFTINSSGGTIDIGNDAVAQAISIGSGAAQRTITIGNSSGATALNLSTGTGGMTVTTDTATFTSANSADPLIVIKNTTASDTNGARLQFVKDKGSVGVNDDEIGVIEFVGDNDAQEQTTFAKILAQASEVDDTDEAGKLSLFVAASNGTVSALTAGLILEGEHATGSEVDVTIANGTSSTTTISGDLSVTSSLTVSAIGAATGDTNKFLVSDSGVLKFRTGDEVISDIGAVSTSTANSFSNSNTFGKQFILSPLIVTTVSTTEGSPENLDETRSLMYFDLALGSDHYGELGAGTTGQILHIFYDNTQAAGTLKITFTTGITLRAGSGDATSLTFNQKGQSASLAYITDNGATNRWCILNTGATVA